MPLSLLKSTLVPSSSLNKGNAILMNIFWNDNKGKADISKVVWFYNWQSSEFRLRSCLNLAQLIINKL